MRLLLDTHTLLWWMTGDAHLPKSASRMIESNVCFVSAASAWEIATKVRLGRLPQAAELVQDFVAGVTRQQIDILPIHATDAICAGLLPGPHRDPFDRMLIAQALTMDLAVVSNDSAFDRYGVSRLW